MKLGGALPERICHRTAADLHTVLTHVGVYQQVVGRSSRFLHRSFSVGIRMDTLRVKNEAGATDGDTRNGNVANLEEDPG